MSPAELWSLVDTRSAEVIEREHLHTNILRRRGLRVKLGIDPTSPDLHLGHVVPLRMLRAFQEAGHRAVLIIGDFTGQIGDPSGKLRTRRQLSAAEAKANEHTYRAQVGQVLDLKRTEIRHNSEWYRRMRLGDFLDLLAKFSLKSAAEREEFKKRMAAGREVHFHEAMYPVLQAYDSVMVRAEVEIGSLDQKLNILAGRELQVRLGKLPQDVLLVPYLIGLDGKEKMSKSAGNTVNLGDAAADVFGKIMAVPDTLIVNYAELAAWMDPVEVLDIRRRLTRGENPRDVKLDIAEAVVALYHGAVQAKRARDTFLAVFSKRDHSAATSAVHVLPGRYRALDLLRALPLSPSSSAARRLISGRALEVDGEVAARADTTVAIRRGSVIRVGKKAFYRVT